MYSNVKLIKSTPNFLFALFRFCSRKKALTMLNFWIFLPLKETLVATMSETWALSSRKYVSESDKSIPNLSEKLRIFWLYPSVFTLEKQT